MQKTVNDSFTGYIEGYYGKLLTWSQRRKIINKLYDTKMSYYLYAPKSDFFHRQNWRENYSASWLKNFKSFTNYSKKKNLVNGPRPLVIKRILAFSKYYELSKKNVDDSEKTNGY